jgi:hypothetical protein
LVALAFTTVASIAVASTMVQPYAVEWRWASELPQSVLVPLELTELIAADTIPTHRASRALVAAIERSVTVAPVTTNLAGVSLPKWVVRPMSLVAPVGRPAEAPHDPPAINPRPIHAAARAMPRADVAGTLLVNEPEALIPCELFLEVSRIDQQFRNSEGHAGYITALIGTYR